MRGGTLAITDEATETKVDCRHLLLVNDGIKTVYIKVEQGADYPEQVTADAGGYFSMTSGESLLLDAELEVKAFSLICGAGNSTSVRWAGW